MTILVKKTERIKSEDDLPQRGTPKSAGYDVVATSDPEIVGDMSYNGYYNSIDYIQYRTGLYTAPQQISVGTFFDLVDVGLYVFPRSSISKYNLLLANSVAVIDSDYRGEILLRYKYIFQPSDLIVDDGETLLHADKFKIYSRGDKIAQLIPFTVNTIEFKLVDELDSTDRSSNGFGSTGK